jgi:hypothetical protein
MEVVNSLAPGPVAAPGGAEPVAQSGDPHDLDE